MDENPYSTSDSQAVGSSAQPGILRRLFVLCLVAAVGIVVGSYVSAELLHLHYSGQARTSSGLISGTIEGTIASPIAMSVGLIPTLSMYGSHGWLVLPGVILTIASSIWYFRKPSWLALMMAAIGFALWAHNNVLSFHALMSV